MNGHRTVRILVGGATVLALVILPIAVEPVRLLCVVGFCLLAPGWGWARRMGTGDGGDKLALTVVISMSASILVATTMVATDTWSAPGGVAALAAIAVLGFVPLRRAGGRTAARGRSHAVGRVVPTADTARPAD